MGTVRKTITLTDRQDQWIKAQIAAGHFTNDSEYIRDLIRRDHERRHRARGAAGRVAGGARQRSERQDGAVHHGGSRNQAAQRWTPIGSR